MQPISGIYFPNAFTPNNDGLNDEFKAMGAIDELTDFYLQIYNRWGQMIFESSSPSKAWDGNYKGEAAEMGSYIYSIKYTLGSSCPGSKSHSETKTFTLLE